MGDGVLHEGLQAQEGHGHRQHLAHDVHDEAQLVAEARPFEQQVAVDAGELVGERGEVARAAQGVPGEVGEVQQQLAGAVGVGARERGDRGQRVADEVRRDLRPQGPRLGVQCPPPRGLQLGQLQLARGPLPDLGGRPYERRAHLGVVGGQRADDPPVDGERHHDGVADGAVLGLAEQLVARDQVGPPAGQDAVDVAQQVAGARLAGRLPGAVPGQHLVGGGHGEGLRAEEGAQVAYGPAGGVARETGPEVGRGHRGEVQGGERGVVGLVVAPGVAAAAAEAVPQKTAQNA